MIIICVLGVENKWNMEPRIGIRFNYEDKEGVI
jgi:hypothetical protein